MVSLLRKFLFAGLIALYTTSSVALTLSVNDSGTWRPTPVVSVNDSGTWRNIRLISVNDGGIWRKVHNVTYHNITIGNIGSDYGYREAGYPGGGYGSIDNASTAFYIVGGSIINIVSTGSAFQVNICGNSSYTRTSPFVKFWALRSNGTWATFDVTTSTYVDDPVQCDNYGSVGGSWTFFVAGPWGASDVGASRMFVAEGN